MTNNPVRLLAVLLLLSGIATSWPASAATYSYESPNYSTIFGSPGLTTAMNVTGSFELEPPLGPNLNNYHLTGLVTEYSFSNGVDTFDETNSVICIAYVSTDSRAQFTQYVFSLRESPAPSQGEPIKFLDFYNPGWTGADSGRGPSPGTSCGALSPDHRAYTDADDYGNWTSPVITRSIPALGTLGLVFMVGLILIGAVITRRRSRSLEF